MTAFALVTVLSTLYIPPVVPPGPPNEEEYAIEELSLVECASYFNDEVTTYEVHDEYDEVGSAIFINRRSRRAKAKYFAHKKDNVVVHDRYSTWRSGKSVFLISSGAYATGLKGRDKPVGLTMDEGEMVNEKVDSDMDGLVIVEAVGGVRVTDITEGNLYLQSLNRRVDVRDLLDREEFINWATTNQATVFQTHLLIYRNQLKVDHANSSRSTAYRRVLILGQGADGDIYHGLVYLRKNYRLYVATQAIKQVVNDDLNMEIIAAVNLDTGACDVFSSGEGVRNCEGGYFTASNNDQREALTNMLAYYYE